MGTTSCGIQKSHHNEEGDKVPQYIWQRGHKYCWLWSAANTSQGLEVKRKLNQESKLQQGHSCRRNRAEVETIQEHDIKFHPILNKFLEQNTKGGVGLSIHQTSNIWGHLKRLQLSHPGNAQTKEIKVIQVTIGYTSISFIERSRPWGCSRQLAHASEQWGSSKTWDQTFVWVSEEISKAVILAYYFMINTNEELPHELARTAPLCQRGQPRQP